MTEKKIFFKYINLIIALAIVLLTMYISRCSSISFDDIAWALLHKDENILDLLLKDAGKIHGGGYINFFLTKFFTWKLPSIFHIHPNNFIIFPMGMIKGIILAFLCYFISKFVNIFSRSRTMQCLLFLTSASIFFFLYCPQDIHNYALTFFRYPFSILIFAIFWFFVIKNIMRKTSKIKIDVLGLVFCAIILGSNLEICIFSSLELSVLFILYNIIIKIFRLHNKYLFNLNFNFYIPISVLFISAILFCNSEGYKWVIGERGLYDINITFDQIIEFSKLFIKYYFIENWIFATSFVILSFIGIILYKKRKNFKQILIPIFMQLSFLCVIASLICCGKTLYGTGKYWIEYSSVIFSYQILSLIPIIILIGSIIRCKNYSKKILFIYHIVIFYLILISIYSLLDINIMQNERKSLRQMDYICDKLTHFYYLKNKTPILPIERDSLYYGIDRNAPMFAEYNELMYKENIKDVNNYKIIYKDDAILKFYEEGGYFSQQELERMDFSMLWDDDFVLNKKATINF